MTQDDMAYAARVCYMRMSTDRSHYSMERAGIGHVVLSIGQALAFCYTYSAPQDAIKCADVKQHGGRKEN